MSRVVKVGGRPQLDPALAGALARAHRAAPGTLVVVHGGGDDATRLQRLHGLEPEFRGGRRVTTAADLEILRLALSGGANKRLVAALVTEGVAAVGLSGEDAALVTAAPLAPQTYGYVGLPVSVNVPVLAHLLAGGLLPVLSPVSRCAESAQGVTLNVNGDDAAAAIAAALGADELLLVSDVPGVLEEGEAIAQLDEEGARRLVASGIAGGGMCAKLEAARRALDGGVGRVRISDIAAIEDPTRGTVVMRAGSLCA